MSRSRASEQDIYTYQVIGYYLVMNKGPWGGRFAEFLKSGGVVDWNVVFLLLAMWPGSKWVCSPKERVCSAKHKEHINSGLLCVVTGSGGRWVRDSFVLTCVRWCLRQVWWSVFMAHAVRRGMGFLCLARCFYCVLNYSRAMYNLMMATTMAETCSC